MLACRSNITITIAINLLKPILFTADTSAVKVEYIEELGKLEQEQLGHSCNKLCGRVISQLTSRKRHK